MAEHGPHCPFLNRTDDRCSAHFSIDRLRSLFAECFGEYQACPVYAELLAERRDRRAQADRARHAGHANRIVQLTVNQDDDRARHSSVFPSASGR
ncbi:MAG TPA: hypothetical protein VHY37_03565 [Tepidisphaeraceae bacterium]|nr:hypothetical protein [Tepidisphaeraceae bacterium]